MTTTKTTTILAILCALLAGALARDVLVAPVQANSAPITRSDVNSIVRALESNAKANSDVARAVQEARRACR